MTDRPVWPAPGSPDPAGEPEPGRGPAQPSESDGTPPEPVTGQPSDSPPAAPSGPPPAPAVPPGWSPEQPPPRGGWGSPAGPATGTPGSGPGGWSSPGTPPGSGSGGWSPPRGGWGRAPIGDDGRGGYGRPGVIPLRPLNIGELLDGAVTAIRWNPRVMLGLSAAVATVTQLIQSFVVYGLLSGTLASYGDLLNGSTTQIDSQQLAAAFGGALLAAAVTGVITAVAVLLLTGLITIVVSRAVLGQRLDSKAAWVLLRPTLGRLVAVTLVIPLMVGVAFLVASIPLMLGVTSLGVLLIAVALVLTVYVGVRLCLAGTVVVIERSTVRTALRRSWQLVGGAWWRTLGVLVLAGIIVLVVEQIVQLPFTVLAGGASVLVGPVSAGAILLSTLGAIAASTITWPFAAGVTVLLYVDRRIRREGLDLELARAAGLLPGSGTQR